MNTMKTPKGTTARRFWSFVAVGRGCWQWTAAKDKDGYGLFRTSPDYGVRRMFRAHRFMYTQTFGPTRGLILHACDNPSCVNPSHLRTGTPKDNSDDMKHKGRQAWGQRVPTSRLTPTQVREIRGADGIASRALAKQYGVSDTAIRLIRKRINWKLL